DDPFPKVGGGLFGPKERCTWVFLLAAVEQVGQALYPDSWLSPPFRQLDTATLSQFQDVIRRVTEACWREALISAYEFQDVTMNGWQVLDFDEPEMRTMPFWLWTEPGWRHLFLLAKVNPPHSDPGGCWIFIRQDSLIDFIAKLVLARKEGK